MAIPLSAVILLVGCTAIPALADPKTTVIPSDSTKWSELQPSTSRLTAEEQGLVTGYLARAKLGEAFGGAGVPAGTTIGQAIDNERAYQARVASTNVVATARTAEQEALRARLEAERTATLNQAASILTVAFISKEFVASDFRAGRISDSFALTFGYENKGPKDMTGFKGTAVFTDIFGDVIKSANLSYDRPLAAGQSVRDPRSLDYNQFTEADRRFRDITADRLRFNFTVETILFADGTQLNVPGTPTAR